MLLIILEQLRNAINFFSKEHQKVIIIIVLHAHTFALCYAIIAQSSSWLEIFLSRIACSCVKTPKFFLAKRILPEYFMHKIACAQIPS